jgi:hypothetical protein
MRAGMFEPICVGMIAPMLAYTRGYDPAYVFLYCICVQMLVV